MFQPRRIFASLALLVFTHLPVHAQWGGSPTPADTVRFLSGFHAGLVEAGQRLVGSYADFDTLAGAVVDTRQVLSGVGTKGGGPLSGDLTLEFDCSEVQGNEITCSGETIGVDEGSGSGLDADLLDGTDKSGLWHPGNDGSGSGLDADLIDGISSGSLVRADASDDVSGHTEWQDNQHVRLGSGADMRMYHNGSHTYFDNYTGNWYMRVNGTEAGFDAVPNSYSSMYYNGSWKFRTTSSGNESNGVLDMNSSRVSEVGEPSASSDAATKNYVDTAGGGASGDWTHGGICTRSTTGTCGSWDLDSYNVNEFVVAVVSGYFYDDLESEWSVVPAVTRYSGGVQVANNVFAYGSGGGTAGGTAIVLGGNFPGERASNQTIVSDSTPHATCYFKYNPSTEVILGESTGGADCAFLWAYR